MDEGGDQSPDADMPGDDAPHARMIVGDFLFVGRATRQEALFAIGVMGRAVSKWKKRHDRVLYRLVCYFYWTAHYGLIGFVNPRDLMSFCQLTLWDADLGGQRDTTRSTSGYATWIRGRNTRVLLEAGSKLQNATEFSTPASETVAGAQAVTRSAFPVNTLLEQVYDRAVKLVLGTDNETCHLDVCVGYSKNMRHLRKHQRLSIGLFNESCDRDDVEVETLPSGKNTSDILTKVTKVHTFQTHRVGLGIGAPEEFGDEPTE